MKQDAILIFDVAIKNPFPYLLQCAKDQNAIGTKEIFGERELVGNPLVFEKSHLPHLLCKRVYIRPQLPLHEVNMYNGN